MRDIFDRFCIQKLTQRLKSPDKRREILEIFAIPPRAFEWFSFMEIISIVFGGLLFATGVIFFIAANWDSLGKFFKFFMVEALILTSLAIWQLSKNELLRKISLMVAFILLGGLLALIGQVYQSGADSWELFFYWAVLGVFWVVAGRFEPLWVLWITITNLALFLYLNSSFRVIFIPADSILTLGLWNLLLLIAFEWARRLELCSPRFLLRILASAVVILLTIQTVISIFDKNSSYFLFFPIWFGGMAFYFWERDSYILSSLAFGFDVVILSIVAKILFTIRGVDPIFAFFVMSVASISVAMFTINFIKTINRDRILKGDDDVLL